MKPSDISISGFPPFVGMFGSCEAEVMAACMVKTLAVTGDEFRGMELAEIAKTIGDLASEPGYWRELITNPFARPSLERLMSVRNDSYGRYQYVEACERGCYQFTFAGLLRLSKNLRTEVPR